MERLFGNDNYSTSVDPRHVSSNRGTNLRSPFLGSVWWDDTIENEVEQADQSEHDSIKKCSELERPMVELCSHYHTQTECIRKKQVKAKSTHQKKAPCSVPPNRCGTKYWSSLAIEDCISIADTYFLAQVQAPLRYCTLGDS